MRRVAFTTSAAYDNVLEAMQSEAEDIARGGASECLFVGEHPLTITLGRSLKAPGQLLAVRAGVPVVSVERGGGATLHNPGQLVIYPLVRLAARGLSPVGFLRILERALIGALATAGLAAGAVAGQTGVWVGERKLASLGVSVAHGVSRHGLALNVGNDLGDFRMISPCGFSSEVMTSVSELGAAAVLSDWADLVCALLADEIGSASASERQALA